jgi:hypothetical protein
MSRSKSVFGFVGRYANMAGRSCCAGRSWVGLNRSLDRHAQDPSADECQVPLGPVPDGSEDVVVAARPDPQPDAADLATSSPTRR